MISLVPHRVCHVITTLELGGAQQNTLYTVQHLDRRRYEPFLICGEEGLLHEEAIQSGVPTFIVPSLRRAISPWYDPQALMRLARLFRRIRPTIVHTHSSKAGVLGRWAARAARVPVIVHTIHGFAHPRAQSGVARRILIDAERATAYVATDAFIGVSAANLREGENLGIIGAQPTRLIPSGVALERFRAVVRPLPRPAHQPLTVGMVACLKAQKAPVDFIRVAARVRASRREGDRPVRFVLVGDGELRPTVEAAIDELGVDVELLGWRRDIPEVLGTFDVMLHTSHWEGLPRVFPEAMATGLPIVATNADGAPEAIADGVTGFLTGVGDLDSLCERVCRLLDDDAMRERFGEAARARVSPWDIDAMVRSQEQFYAELLGIKEPKGHPQAADGQR